MADRVAVQVEDKVAAAVASPGNVRATNRRATTESGWEIGVLCTSVPTSVRPTYTSIQTQEGQGELSCPLVLVPDSPRAAPGSQVALVGSLELVVRADLVCSFLSGLATLVYRLCSGDFYPLLVRRTGLYLPVPVESVLPK